MDGDWGWCLSIAYVLRPLDCISNLSLSLLSGFTIDEMGENSWLGDTLIERTCFDWMGALKNNRTRLSSHILVYSIDVSSHAFCCPIMHT